MSFDKTGLGPAHPLFEKVQLSPEIIGHPFPTSSLFMYDHPRPFFSCLIRREGSETGSFFSSFFLQKGEVICQPFEIDARPFLQENHL